MSKLEKPNALKHGVFSKILFLPGEDPQEYEKLKAALFAEYKPSGVSEERIMTAIANTFWQEERSELYEYVQVLRARKSGSGGVAGKEFIDCSVVFAEQRAAYRRALEKEGIDLDNLPEHLKRKKEKWKAMFGGGAANAETTEKSDDELLLELGDLVTIDNLDKQLNVENKIQAKRERLFKSFFQIRAMKPLIGLGEAPASSSISSTPVLELTATEPTKSSELSVETSVSESKAIEPTLELPATEPIIPSEMSGELPVSESSATAPPIPSELLGETPASESTATEPTILSEVSSELPVVESPTTDPTIPSELSGEAPALETTVTDPTKPSEE
jgi:hypothetical protein